jgi:hypothetical protein
MAPRDPAEMRRLTREQTVEELDSLLLDIDEALFDARIYLRDSEQLFTALFKNSDVKAMA